ncbi:ABC transporter substrate-binding protein [Nocardioides sp. LHD-245]|uniref:ABC transporter substrate-binding protein n=1 Tax=Nocardioides sp. LHD-245 TaxID=3051387 RepID=UPI0027E02EF3|nr:ABC transporter substrate-binding protein [Nocardioides sp. LHD-245]
MRIHKNNLSRAGHGTAVVALALALAACGSGSSSGDTADGKAGTVRVAMVCGGMTPMAAQIAINANTFPDGLEVKKVCFDSGSDAMQALIGGSLDIFMGSTEHVLSTRAQGLDTRGFAGVNVRAPYALLTSADSNIESVADIEGETVGVTSPGSLADTELKIAASEEDIDYASLKVIGAGSGATMASAIKQGQVAAGMVSEPQRSELLSSGDYRQVWEPEFEYAAIIAVAKDDWVSKNEKSMRAFLEGLNEAATKAEGDPSWGVEAMKKEKFPVSDEVLADAVQRGLTTIPDGLAVSESVYESTTQNLVAVGALDEADVLPFDEVFDLAYIPKAP